jgi:hypothetical protein
MTIRFIADMDARTWTRYGEVDSLDFEIDICMYVPFDTKIKNYSQHFNIYPAKPIYNEIEEEEFEIKSFGSFFQREDLDIPDLSARIASSYRTSNLILGQTYIIEFSISNLRKTFKDSFLFRVD